MDVAELGDGHDAAALAAALEPLLPGLLGVPGACALLAYSCLLTRGPAACRRDGAAAGAEPGGSLVVGPMATCSMELVTLLLAGRAHGLVLAYHPLTGQVITSMAYHREPAANVSIYSMEYHGLPPAHGPGV